MTIPENIIKPQEGYKYESNELNELYGALAKAQGEMDIAINESTNPFYKSRYANLAQIVAASRPYLAKQGLSVIQRVLSNGNDKMYLLTRLCHTSGQWIESKMPISPVKPDIQSIGSYITYLRRYNFASIVGVVTDDQDDDGEAAMNSTEARNEPLDEKQLKEIKKLLGQLPKTVEDTVLKTCQASDLSKITKAKYTGAVGYLNKCIKDGVK